MRRARKLCNVAKSAQIFSLASCAKYEPKKYTENKFWLIRYKLKDYFAKSFLP